MHRPTPSQLRIARWCRGLTLLDMQIKTGIPATTMSLAERGLVQLSLCEQILVADTLSASVGDLFTDVGIVGVDREEKKAT